VTLRLTMSESALLPLSVLELATVGSGQSSAEALASTTEVAQAAERLGYSRLWVAEHHNMPAVASTSPPVLIAHLAARTERIRIGSGGVMLPNHAPLVVAEQFALLEALHPGRIDLGIGRAPGTDQQTALALRRDPAALSAEDFPQHLLDLLGLLGDRRVDGGLAERFVATPAARSAPEVVLLGSSGFSAQLAGALGLPFNYAHHFGTHAQAAVELYRDSFRPSPILSRPYTMLTANVLVADDDAEAQRLALPGRLMMLAIRTNRLRAVPSLAEAEADPQRATAEAMPVNWIVGEPGRAADELRRLAVDTGADEVMVTSNTHSGHERVRSLELLAEAWGLSPSEGRTAA
jgi:luciferase family oxidoreductase group 1